MSLHYNQIDENLRRMKLTKQLQNFHINWPNVNIDCEYILLLLLHMSFDVVLERLFFIIIPGISAYFILSYTRIKQMLKLLEGQLDDNHHMTFNIHI